MNEVLNKFSKNLMNSFFKDESKNKLTRHRKIYNLKLDFITQYKPSIKSLRNAYLKEENKRRNRGSVVDGAQGGVLKKGFRVHKQSLSSHLVEKEPVVRSSGRMLSKDSFHYFEVTDFERKRSKRELDASKQKNFRVFSKNSLICPKQVFAESPSVKVADVMLMRMSKQTQSCKHDQVVKNQGVKREKRVKPRSFSPVKPVKQFKRVIDLTIKGWDKIPSFDNFLLSSESN